MNKKKKEELENKMCKCGNIIHSFDHSNECFECRNKEWKRKREVYLRILEKKLNLQKNNAQIIVGGYDQDNDMQNFNDYFDTLLRMKINLEKRDCSPPFTIISHQEVFNYAGIGNNVNFIAIQYNPEVEIENLWDINEESCSIKKVAINERDYILSQKWIKSWKINNDIGNTDFQIDYRLMLTDGIKAIITGWLTLI